MMNQKLIIPVIVFLASVLGGCQTSEIEVSDLNIKFISNIDMNPVFSWKISSKQPGFKQLLFRVIDGAETGFQLSLL